MFTYLIVGLGNPGTGYLNSPHNAGFGAVIELRFLLKAVKFTVSSDSLVSSKTVAGAKALLALPQTFMNRSGIAVGRLLSKHDIPLSNLIVCYDDLDLPFGAVRLRPRGGAGGHHGLESIIEETGSGLFPRVRIGVKNDSVEKENVVDYLLAPLDEERFNGLQEAARKAAEAMRDALFLGFQKAMTIHNKRGAREEKDDETIQNE